MSIDPGIKQMLDAYSAAVLARNVDAFMALYDDDVRVFDAWGHWSSEGAASWRKPVNAWLSSLVNEQVVAEFDEVRATVTGGMASVSATVTYTSKPVSGDGASKSMQNRLSWALVRRGDAWKIIHEHTSAPAGFADGKVILKRDKAR